MNAMLDWLPIASAAFAVPQFLPQLVQLSRTGDSAGVSWSWAALTSISNGGWIAYFALSGFWTSLVPAGSVTVLAGVLAILLSRSARVTRRQAVITAGWAGILAIAGAVGGRVGLGTVLTASFVLQVTPSVWTAYRTERPTGIARGTWLLILGELVCWGAYGYYQSDPRLIVLGWTGVTASLLMLARAHSARSKRPTPRQA